MARGEGGGPPLGSKNAQKLNTLELKVMAYEQYCNHLAKGKSKRSWCFEHPELTLTWETMEKYLKDEVIFDPLKKKVAETKGYGYWESVVEDSAIGNNEKANTATLQMLMRNKYGWDKQQHNPQDTDSTHEHSFSNLMQQIKHYQDSARNIAVNSSINEQKS